MLNRRKATTFRLDKITWSTIQIPRLKHEDIIYLKPPISGHTNALLTAEKGPAQIMTVFSTLSGKL